MRHHFWLTIKSDYSMSDTVHIRRIVTPKHQHEVAVAHSKSTFINVSPILSVILFKYRYRRYRCSNVSLRVSAILFNAKYVDTFTDTLSFEFANFTCHGITSSTRRQNKRIVTVHVAYLFMWLCGFSDVT